MFNIRTNRWCGYSPYETLDIMTHISDLPLSQWKLSVLSGRKTKVKEKLKILLFYN